MLLPMWASAQSCNDIKDKDKANYCRALDTNDKSHCQKLAATICSIYVWAKSRTTSSIAAASPQTKSRRDVKTAFAESKTASARDAVLG